MGRYSKYMATLFGKVHSLPNGVTDELTATEYIQRVQGYTLQASDITGIVTAHTNVDWIMINKPVNDALIGSSATSLATSNQKIIDGYIPGSVYSDNVANIGTHINFSTNNFALCISKGAYADVSAARTALAGTKIWYQLATPIVTPI